MIVYQIDTRFPGSYEILWIIWINITKPEFRGIAWNHYTPATSFYWSHGVFSWLICGRGKITAIVFWYEMHMDVEGWMCFPLGQICVRDLPTSDLHVQVAILLDQRVRMLGRKIIKTLDHHDISWSSKARIIIWWLVWNLVFPSKWNDAANWRRYFLWGWLHHQEEGYNYPPLSSKIALENPLYEWRFWWEMIGESSKNDFQVPCLIIGGYKC